MREYSYVVFNSFLYLLNFYGIEIIKELISNTFSANVQHLLQHSATVALQWAEKSRNIVREKGILKPLGNEI